MKDLEDTIELYSMPSI